MSLGSGGGRLSLISGVVVSFRLLWVPLGEQASGRRWDCSGLGHVGTKWYSDEPGARSTRDGGTSNEDDSSFADFLKLDNDKIILAQKFGDTGPYQFLFNRFMVEFFENFN